MTVKTVTINIKYAWVNYQKLSLSLQTLLLGRRSRGRQWKRWIENIQEDLEQRGCSKVTSRRKIGQDLVETIHKASLSKPLEERRTAVKKKKYVIHPTIDYT